MEVFYMQGWIHHSLTFLRAWESLSTVTCCRSLVIVYDGICVLQIGYAFASSSYEGELPMVVDPSKLMQGSIYQGVVKSGSRKPQCWYSKYLSVIYKDCGLRSFNNFDRELLGKLISLSWKIRAAISPFKYTGITYVVKAHRHTQGA